MFEINDLQEEFCPPIQIINDYINVKDFFYNNNEIKILYINIRSVRKNFNELILLLNILDVEIEIIILTEIWIETCEIKLYNIPGYNQFFKCTERNKSGGTMIYIKKDYKIEIINVNMETADIVSVYFKELALQLIAIYRSHDFSVLSFVDEIEMFLKNIKVKNVYLIGDININILLNSNDTHYYLNMLSAYGFNSAINEVTRYDLTNNTGTCIDHIFYRQNSFIKSRFAILQYPLTDHYLLLVSINKLENKSLVKPKNQNYKEFNLNIFKEIYLKLTNVTWFDKDNLKAVYDSWLDRCVLFIKKVILILP